MSTTKIEDAKKNTASQTKTDASKISNKKDENPKNETGTMVITPKGELKDLSVQEIIDRGRKIHFLSNRLGILNDELKELKEWENADPSMKSTLTIEGETSFTTTNTNLILKTIGFVKERYEFQIGEVEKEISQVY